MNELTKPLQSFIRKYLKGQQFHAVLGLPDGTLFLTDDDNGTVDFNHVWVIGNFSTGGLSARVALCRKINPVYGAEVIVQQSLNNDELEVIEEDSTPAIARFGDDTINVPKHAWQHGRFGFDTVYISAFQFTPGLTRPNDTPDLNVYIEPFPFEYSGVNYEWPGGLLDLSSFVPTDASTQVPMVIYFDPATNTVAATAGTEIFFAGTNFKIMPFTADDIVGIDTTGYIRLSSLRLYTGQTKITIYDFIEDLRTSQWFSPASSGGSGTPATSVTDETTFGVSPAVGTSLNYAREDHTHGSEPHDDVNNLSGVLPVDHGGTGADLITSGPGVIIQPSFGGPLGPYTLVPLVFGGTDADLSATGGAGKVLKQVTAGADITVDNLTHAELTSVSADQHHNKSHAHNGADGSGTVAGTDLTGSSANTILGQGSSGGLAWKTASQIKTILAIVAADISDFTTAVNTILGALTVSIIPTSDNARDLGSTSFFFKNLFSYFDIFKESSAPSTPSSAVATYAGTDKNIHQVNSTGQDDVQLHGNISAAVSFAAATTPGTAVISEAIAANSLGTKGHIYSESKITILNNSGSGRIYTVTYNFGSYSISLSTAAQSTSATDRTIIILECTTHNDQAQNAQVHIIHFIVKNHSAAANVSAATADGWGFDTSTVTTNSGTVTVSHFIFSANNTATQTITGVGKFNGPYSA